MINKIIKQLIFILLLIITLYVFTLIINPVRNVLIVIGKIILPFLIAFVIAFILQPLICFTQKYVKKRCIAVLIVLVIFIMLFTFLFQLTIPKLIEDIKMLQVKFPEIIDEIEMLVNKVCKYFSFLPDDYKPTYDGIIDYINNYIRKLNTTNEDIVTDIFSYFILIITVPIILIYFLLDYEKMLNYIRNKLIETNHIRLKDYLADLNKIMSSYFRGVLIVMVILFCVFSIAFSIMKVDYAMLFSFIIAVTNIIPYIGSYIGTALPVLYSLIDSSKKGITVLIVCVIIQTLEADLLTPYIQGKQIKLHPLLVLLFVLSFGSVFGIIGMMFAVPALAFLKITFKHYPLKWKFKK